LLILDDAPFELPGRVAVGGRLLLEDDRVARVRREAMTRRSDYFDELPGITRSHREFAAALAGRTGRPWRMRTGSCGCSAASAITSPCAGASQELTRPAARIPSGSVRQAVGFRNVLVHD
jgi:hypothetical protein